MNDSIEILGKLERGELRIDDLDPDVRIVVIHTAEVTKEMIDQARISKELFDEVLKCAGPHELPSVQARYEDGVLYKFIWGRKRSKDNS